MADVEVQVASGERAEGLEVPSKPRRVSPREIELRQRLVQLLREQRGLKSRLTGIKRRLERAGAQTGEKERAGVKRDRDGLAPDEAEPRAKRARIDVPYFIRICELFVFWRGYSPGVSPRVKILSAFCL